MTRPADLSAVDHRLSVFYGVVFIGFASLAMMHPPITGEVVAKIEGRNVTGPVVVASKKADRR